MAAKTTPDTQTSLLGAAARQGKFGAAAPLADRMRPRTLDELLGQPHLLKEGRLLADAIRKDRVPSMILWGPPGSGKTSLAHVISRATRAEFVPFSAVLGGVAELRLVIHAARERRDYAGRATLLFVDEIHRFNKSQQDAFLPHVEAGIVTLIGATTENPSFSVNAAVLSRCRVFRLEGIAEADQLSLLLNALQDAERGLGKRALSAEPEALAALVRASQGDARRALGMLETCAALQAEDGGTITLEHVGRAAEESTLLYDRSGEEHYNVVSALIKSLRGSDPDAALYWMFRMLDAGDDPLFVSRRLLIFASEDVGNADPRALSVAVNADAAFRRMGMPEGAYPLAHACLYLASCPKSDGVKRAMQSVRAAIQEHGALPVPKKLRNAVSALMAKEGYGANYRYPHDYSDAVAPGETYLPDELLGARFYEPTDHGLEKAIAERLARLRKIAPAKRIVSKVLPRPPSPTAARVPRRSPEMVGIGAMALGVALLTLMDSAVKGLVNLNYSVLQIVAGRGAMICLGMLALGARPRFRESLRTPAWKLHGLRALVGFFAPTLFFVALRYLPLADTTILFFAAPFLMTALAVPMLGEKVPRAHWLFIAMGFVGVVIAAGPTRVSFERAALLPLASAVAYAYMAVLGRRMRKTESVFSLVFYFNAVHTLLASIALPFVWRPVSLLAFGLLVVVAGLGVIGQFLLTFALRVGRVSVIAPFEYSGLIWSVAAGALLFGEVPTLHVALGAAIIGISGIYLALHANSEN